MARLIDAFKQFSDGKGVPFSGGQLFFFANKTANLKDTWSDVDLNNLNSNPVILDGSGNAPPIFGQETYTVTLKTKDGVFIDSFDDIVPEGDSGGAAFANWSSTVAYLLPSYVTGSDGCIYQGVAASTNTDPTTDDGSTWIKIEFTEYYSATETYSIGEKVKVTSNDVYRSLVNSNINNEPTADAGVNWQLENPIQAWVTGRTYNIGDVALGADARLHKAVISQKGNNPVGDSGTNWLPNDGSVSTPSNTTPSASATDVSRTPTLVTSAYVINGSTAAHEWSRYRIYSEVGLANIVYDSQITTDLTIHTITDQLAAATEFFWIANHKGTRTNVSASSTVTSFTTTLNLSESFDNLTFVGTGSTQSILATPDLNSNTGAVFLVNVSTTDSMRITDTDRGVGNAYLVPSQISTAEATGLTAFNFNGYDVGAAAPYNGSGNTIWSIVLKKTAKFFDIVNYSGSGINRTVAHSLNTDVGFVVIQQKTGATPALNPSNICWVRGIVGTQFIHFGFTAGIATLATMWNSTTPTTSVFSLGTADSVNGTSRDYTAYLLSHNPSAGVYCSTFTAAGTATDKITTGFPGATVFLKFVGGSDDWKIMDKKLGTGSQIDFDSQAQLVAGNNISSFDSDGVTLSSLASGTWAVIVLADPDL